MAVLAPGLELPQPEQQDYELWLENVETWLFFCGVQTQWRTSMAGLVGLDYGAILAVAALHEVEDKRQLLTELQWIESAILSELAEQTERGRHQNKSKSKRTV